MNTGLKFQSPLPHFDLQTHHHRVKVPTEFDLRDIARKYSVFPLRVISQNGRKRLLLAMQNPYDQSAILDVEFRSGLSVVAVQADQKDIQWLIQTHYFGRKLSPSPTIHDRPVSHDVFEQLEITTDAQSQPEWVTTQLRPFVKEDNKDN